MGITCSWQKTNTLETRSNTWLFTHKPLEKKSEWKCQLQASEIYLHWVSVTAQWTLSRVTNCKSTTSHSLPGIRNENSSWFFITCAKPEDTLTCKASGNHFSHTESIFVYRRVTALHSHHYNPRTTKLGYNSTKCTEQTRDPLNKLKVSKKKQEPMIYTSASKARYESIKERRGIS